MDWLVTTFQQPLNCTRSPHKRKEYHSAVFIQIGQIRSIKHTFRHMKEQSQNNDYVALMDKLSPCCHMPPCVFLQMILLNNIKTKPDNVSPNTSIVSNWILKSCQPCWSPQDSQTRVISKYTFLNLSLIHISEPTRRA